MLAICALGTVCYCNSFSGPFIFDDVRNISDNPHIRIESLSPSELATAATQSRAPRPIAYISFAVNYYFSGFDVRAYHVCNLVIHLLNGLLVYALALQTFRLCKNFADDKQQSHTNEQRLGLLACFAACLFVAHPLQTQAVVYIVQRMASLATLFYLLSLLLYIRGQLTSSKQLRLLCSIGCILSGLLALGSKQIAATLPIAILLYHIFFLQKFDTEWLKKSAKIILPLLALAAVISFFCLGSNPWQRIAENYSLRDFTITERLLTQFRVVMQYISLILLPLPSRLNLLHHVPISHSLFNPLTTLLSLLAIMALFAGSLIYAKKYRLVSFGCLWFLLHLVIESSILPLEIMYEHRVYLPMVGIVLVAAWLLEKLIQNSTALATAVATVILLTCSLATFQRAAIWQDEMTFWNDVIQKNPLAARAYVERGKLHSRRSELEQAIDDYNQALTIQPKLATAYNNRGAALGQLGKYESALLDCNQAINLRPKNAAAYNNRGTLHNLLGNQKAALEDYNQAIQLNAIYTDAYFNRANVQFLLRNFDAALDGYNTTLKLNNSYANAYPNRAAAHEQLANYHQAIEDYTIAVRLIPDNPQVAARLAWLLATSPQAENRDGRRAQQLAQSACEATNWKNSFCLEALAAAHAEQGNFAAAIDRQSQAIQLIPENQKPPLVARLELYLAKTPYRQPE